MSDKIRDAVQHLVVDALTAADLVRSGHRSKALSDRLSQHCSVLSKMLAATPTTAAAPEPAEVHLTLAEEEYEAPIVLRAFANKAEAEVFAQALRDYQQARPEWPVGDEEPEEVLERDKETRAWMAAHPGGEDAAWRRFFSVIAVPFSVAPTCAAQDGDAQLDAMRRSGLSIDGDNAYKRDLIDCIVGALMLGKQGVNPPPAGHWLEQFWQTARGEGEIQEQLAAAPAAPELEGDDLTVWRITLPSGEQCHFGTESMARAWGRGEGKVERVDLKVRPRLEVVHTPSAAGTASVEDGSIAKTALAEQPDTVALRERLKRYFDALDRFELEGPVSLAVAAAKEAGVLEKELRAMLAGGAE